MQAKIELISVCKILTIDANSTCCVEFNTKTEEGLFYIVNSKTSEVEYFEDLSFIEKIDPILWKEHWCYKYKKDIILLTFDYFTLEGTERFISSNKDKMTKLTQYAIIDKVKEHHFAVVKESCKRFSI